jgi:hypothetical protein
MRLAFKLTLIFGILSFHLSGFALELRTGDILLQPLSCWTCSLIEAQERSIYSHVGIVVATGPQVLVAESYSPHVEIKTFTDFSSKTERGQSIRVIRAKADISRYPLRELVEEKYLNLSYDAQFRINNFDQRGEKIYCSELVYKMFEHFNIVQPQLKIMDFDINPDYWDRFFGFNTPRGELGISPADYERSDFFYTVGDVQ